MASNLTAEIAGAAARLIVEEGMEYGPAKHHAARALCGKGQVKSAQMPDNQMIEEEVRAYIDLFCADTQPAELRALREVAAMWMERLQPLRPYLTGAVWRGTATRLNSVHIQLFCDDPKEAEITLLNQRISFDVGSATGLRGDPVDVLTVCSPNPGRGDPITVHFSILDADDLRGALLPGARGQAERGDLPRLRQRMAEAEAP